MTGFDIGQSVAIGAMGIALIWNAVLTDARLKALEELVVHELVNRELERDA